MAMIHSLQSLRSFQSQARTSSSGKSPHHSRQSIRSTHRRLQSSSTRLEPIDGCENEIDRDSQGPDLFPEFDAEEFDNVSLDFLERSKETDRGWAWMVVFGSFMGHIFVYGVGWTVGIFYMIFLGVFRNKEETTETNTAWIVTLNTACLYLGGPISSIISNRFNSRFAIIIGTIMASTGLAVSSLANGIFFLYASFGVCTGLGIGIAYVPVVSTVALYFEKYRNLAMGLAVAGVGMGTFLYPPLMRMLIAAYDWRGSLLILAAINLNMLVVAAILRPPDYVTLAQRDSERSPGSKITSWENHKAVTTDTMKTKRSVFNLSIFKNTDFLLLSINNLLFLFGLSIVYIYLITYAVSLGFDPDKSSMLISVIGIANLVGRIVMGFVGQHPRVNVIGLYCVSLIIVGFLTLLCTQIRFYPGLLVYAVLYGLFSAALGTLLPEVIVNIVGLTRMNSAYGYLLAFEAIGFLLGGPAGGWILHQFGHNYDGVFFLGGGVTVISGFVMVVPWNRTNKPWDLSELDEGPRLYFPEPVEEIEAVLSTV